jgi:tetratricopeptide (TPR) repeat protein
MTRRTALLLVGLAVVVGSAGAWWMLVTPDNPVTQLFRRKITDVDARVVLGPYPGERDLRLLKQNGVGLIVSLLDPAIPYESTLLDRERRLAGQIGIPVLNFPMSSILGKKFGNYYDDSAAKAAAAIAATGEKTYLHCYLGVHRIKVVQALLAAKGVGAGKYVVRSGDRDAAAMALDAADAAYRAGQFEGAIEKLAQVDENRLSDSARLLRAWSHYRLGRIAEARRFFEAFLAVAPDHPDAMIGLAYVEYRDNRLPEAERLFVAALAKKPADADGAAGLGLTLLRQGRVAEATAQLEAAQKLAPDNQDVRDALARIRQGK